MRLIQSGPRDAKIMIVGEAPAEAEMQMGKPFSGGAGVMLSHMLSRAGISMSQCFLTNVVHRPSPKTKGKAVFDQFYKAGPLQLDYVKGVMQLKKDMEEIKPNLVIGLGNGALFTLTGKKGIDKHRGSIYESRLRAGQKVICTYSHGFPLQVYEAKAVVEIDFMRCAEDAKFPELRLPERQYFLNPEPSVRQPIVDEMMVCEWLAIDIECLFDEATKQWRLTCVGFSDRADRALVIPWGDELQKHHIRMLCESEVKKIYQNGMFDVSVMRQNGVNPKNFAWDTMSGHHSLMAESASGEDEMSKLSGKKRTVVLKKGLGFQTSIYTREPFYKDDGKVSDEGVRDWQTFWLYNGKDAAVTREIRDVQERELLEWGGIESAHRKIRLAEPLMAATATGIRIDTELRAAVRADFELKIERLQNFLDAGAGQHVNVKATKDVQWLLYDKLKLPVKTSRKTGNVTADKNAINELGGKYNNPLLQTVLRIREYRDFIERYLSAPLSADNRMRCSFDPTGTKSNRLASRASLDGSGTNLQNIPIRKKRAYSSNVPRRRRKDPRRAGLQASRKLGRSIPRTV
jgi:uracil-DNA glycosylase family 4